MVDLTRMIQGGMDLATAFGRGDQAYQQAMTKTAQMESLILDARQKQNAARAREEGATLLRGRGTPESNLLAIALEGGLPAASLGITGKTNEAFTLSPGSKRFGADGKVIAEVPFAPANAQVVDVDDGAGGTVQMVFDPRSRSWQAPQFGGGSAAAPASLIDVVLNGAPARVGSDLTPEQMALAQADMASGGNVQSAKFPDRTVTPQQFGVGGGLGYKPPKQKDAPSGYTWDASGASLVPIPGGPADRKANPTAGDQAQGEMGMRKELAARLKDDRSVMTMFQNVQNAANNTSAAGDLSLIFAYMKMLDPGSVVREQEFANAQNAAGVPDRIRNMWNKALAGERLNPNQRADFMGQARLLANSAQERLSAATREYQGIADDYGYDPVRATGMADFRDVSGSASTSRNASAVNALNNGPVQVQTEEDYNRLPPGALFITPDGAQRRKK